MHSWWQNLLKVSASDCLEELLSILVFLLFAGVVLLVRKVLYLRRRKHKIDGSGDYD